MVDGFRFQNASCKSYLLTHFHSDHTTGLAKSFNAGLIFCTAITARLLRKDMGMPPERICELEMDKPKLIEGAEVTPIDANHCPGACMFLIKTKATSDRKAQVLQAAHKIIRNAQYLLVRTGGHVFCQDNLSPHLVYVILIPASAFQTEHPNAHRFKAFIP